MRTSEQINEIAAALAKAQGAIEGAKKDSLNPHFKNRYADLAAVWDACREHLAKNGISVIQPVCHPMSDIKYSVTVTRLMHTSGQWIEDGGVPLLLGKEDMQGLGSALTYSRRYGLMAMVGIAPEDDDANAAVAKPTPTVEVVAPKTNKPIPTGAVRLAKTEQHETSAGKRYWLLVLSTGEEVIEWREQAAAFAEQAAQDGVPVIIKIQSGEWNGKWVVRDIVKAEQGPKPNGSVKKVKELTADEVPF